jgi:hypothetical protein
MFNTWQTVAVQFIDDRIPVSIWHSYGTKSAFAPESPPIAGIEPEALWLRRQEVNLWEETRP